MDQMPHSWIGTLLPILIVGLVLLLRMRRLTRASRLRVERLWILPVFHACLVTAIFWLHPPHGLLWLYVALAFLIGVPLGWYRGKLMRISVDPRTHEMSQQASPAAILFIIALVALRSVGREIAMVNGGSESPEAILAVTDILLAFALGFLASQRVEMTLRARTMLAEARRATP